MKKLTLSLLSFLLTFSMFAGGIVTNTNQSAAWTRMLVRDASTGVDAVFYNPAGLTKLADGLHISLNNQTIGQLKTVSTANNLFKDYTADTPVDYEGKIFAPVFPGLYLAYKTGNWAFSFGFNGIGGGGSATFESGLPSMELPVASMKQMFAPMGVTDYRMNMSFEGSSIYFGFQLGASYAISENISVYAGGRYVMAKNTYAGELGGVEITADGTNWVAPGDYLRGVASAAAANPQLAQAAQAVTDLNAGADGLQLTFASGALGPNPTLVPLSYIEPTGGDLTNGLLGLGYTQAQIDAMSLTLGDVQSIYRTAASTYQGQIDNANRQIAYLNQMAAGVDVQTADQKAEVTQTGNGFTPIIGLNISGDKFNIGMKYEFKTSLTLVNDTKLDFATAWDASGNVTSSMFPDEAEINADMPAMFSIGAKYEVIDGLSLQAGFHTYFDSQVEWENVVDIDGNSTEYAFGAEYNVTDEILVSAGWLMTRTSARESYHNDLSYSLNTNTFGAGGAYKINDMFTVELGGFYTLYEDQVNTKYNELVPSFYEETYKKTAWGVGVGVQIHLFGDSVVTEEVEE